MKHLETKEYAQQPDCTNEFPFMLREGGLYEAKKQLTDDEIILAAKEILAARAKKGVTITNPSDLIDYLLLHISDYEHEVFCVTFLDSGNRVIAHEVLATGALTFCVMPPREIIKRALHYNACAVILAHNHPGGSAKPSKADIDMTKQARAALDTVDIRMLDHIIVAKGGKSVSFAEMKLI